MRCCFRIPVKLGERSLVYVNTYSVLVSLAVFAGSSEDLHLDPDDESDGQECQSPAELPGEAAPLR